MAAPIAMMAAPAPVQAASGIPTIVYVAGAGGVLFFLFRGGILDAVGSVLGTGASALEDIGEGLIPPVAHGTGEVLGGALTLLASPFKFLDNIGQGKTGLGEPSTLPFPLSIFG